MDIQQARQKAGLTRHDLAKALRAIYGLPWNALHIHQLETGQANLTREEKTAIQEITSTGYGL